MAFFYAAAGFNPTCRSVAVRTGRSRGWRGKRKAISGGGAGGFLPAHERRRIPPPSRTARKVAAAQARFPCIRGSSAGALERALIRVGPSRSQFSSFFHLGDKLLTARSSFMKHSKQMADNRYQGKAELRFRPLGCRSPTREDPCITCSAALPSAFPSPLR